MLKTIAEVKKKWLFLIILLLQITLLTTMIFSNYLVISQGDRIILQVEPVDPRSLFQGDYVHLNYAFSTLDLSTLNNDVNIDNVNCQDDIYLVFNKQEEVSAPIFATQDKNLVEDTLYIKGKIRYVSSATLPLNKHENIPQQGPLLYVDWNIENYFVPEGKGKEIEEQIRKGIAYAEVSLYKGKARVTDLIVK